VNDEYISAKNRKALFVFIIYHLSFIIYHLRKVLGLLMPKENILLDKSLHFAGRIVKLHKYLLTASLKTAKSNRE
jgi:hypothetical protein